MLSNNVSKITSKGQFTVTFCTFVCDIYLLVVALLDCLIDGGFSTALDSTCKTVPLVNGATTTSSSLISKLKSKEWLSTFVNKVKFSLLALLCTPLTLLKKGKYEFYSTVSMFLLLVLDFCFVFFCAYAALRTFCPDFANAIGLTELTAVSNIKEVKGIRQCYVYFKQQFFFMT